MTVTDMFSIWSLWSSHSFDVKNGGKDDQVSLKQEANRERCLETPELLKDLFILSENLPRFQNTNQSSIP